MDISSSGSSTDLSNRDKAKLIEALLVGPSSGLFRDFEQKNSGFCPFEAIGMVRQEIKHAHFLSYILDPNRSHPFEDHLLKLFLLEVVAQAQNDMLSIQPLSIHCSDMSNALVYRERANVDFLIEVPAQANFKNGKGLIITVEMKIDAAESDHQLKKYFDHVNNEYPDDGWEKAFVFLTLDATAPSNANSLTWIPISLSELVEQLHKAVQLRDFSGGAVDLFNSYAAMIRRHLVEDEELAQIARSIWSKHRQALEALYNFKPDLQGEIIKWLRSNHSTLFSEVKSSTDSKFSLLADSSSNRLLRFVVDEWRYLPRFCEGDSKWVSSGDLIAIELLDCGNGFLKLSFILGPGDDELRTKVYDAISRERSIKIGRKRSVLDTKFKYLSSKGVQTVADYSKALESEVSAEELGSIIIRKMQAFLKDQLPVYDRILRQVLQA